VGPARLWELQRCARSRPAAVSGLYWAPLGVRDSGAAPHPRHRFRASVGAHNPLQRLATPAPGGMRTGPVTPVGPQSPTRPTGPTPLPDAAGGAGVISNVRTRSALSPLSPILCGRNNHRCTRYHFEQGPPSRICSVAVCSNTPTRSESSLSSFCRRRS
jgi:hypothetical protein